MIAKLNNIVREILSTKKYILRILIEKVDAYQDDRKSWNDLSLLEHLNAKCDNKAKNLITNAIWVDYNSGLPFQLSSLLVLYRGTKILTNIADLRTTMYRSLA